MTESQQTTNARASVMRSAAFNSIGNRISRPGPIKIGNNIDRFIINPIVPQSSPLRLGTIFGVMAPIAERAVVDLSSPAPDDRECDGLETIGEGGQFRGGGKIIRVVKGDVHCNR